MESAFRPLVADVFPPGAWSDLTGRQIGAEGVTGVALYVVAADVTGAQLAQIKSDDRFFVLEPGPGYNGAALAAWLDGKGATGHGIAGGDPAVTARAKLIAYLKDPNA